MTKTENISEKTENMSDESDENQIHMYNKLLELIVLSIFRIKKMTYEKINDEIRLELTLEPDKSENHKIE